MNDSFVYCWSDHATAKVYVGIHKGTDDDGYVCSSKHMKKAYVERPQDFTRQIIARGSFNDCAVFEVSINKQLVKNLDTCYNRTAGKAIVLDEEARKLIGQKTRLFRTGRKMPPEIGLAISKAKKGKKFSKEHREALSRAQKGRKDSPERIAIRAVALKGINKGLKSDLVKSKISLRVKELWQDPEYRAKTLSARTLNREQACQM